MDAYEARLTEEIQQRRAELVARAEKLRRVVVETIDPRETVKRHPLGGLLTSLGAGMFLGGMLPGRSGRANGASKGAPAPASESSLFGTVAAGVLSSVLPGLIPMLVGPLMSLITPKPRTRKRENGRPPDPRA